MNITDQRLESTENNNRLYSEFKVIIRSIITRSESNYF